MLHVIFCVENDFVTVLLLVKYNITDNTFIICWPCEDLVLFCWHLQWSTAGYAAGWCVGRRLWNYAGTRGGYETTWGLIHRFFILPILTANNTLIIC